MNSAPPSRADRRRATEDRILTAARKLFAERGFERTTIRAVAAAAHVDPALVMQYFGSKRELFTRAVQAPAAPSKTARAGAPVDQLLTALGIKLGGLPDGTLAALRSMLTDPDAADHAREMLGAQIDSLGAALPADDAALRATLALTTVVGVTIGHQLLGLPALRNAPADRIAALLHPALSALLDPGTGPDGAAASDRPDGRG